MGISKKELNSRKKLKRKVLRWKLSQIDKSNNYEPQLKKHFKNEKGNTKVIVIPSFSKINFRSNETRKQYKIYITKFLTYLYDEDKITLKKIKKIKWSQINTYF